MKFFNTGGEYEAEEVGILRMTLFAKKKLDVGMLDILLQVLKMLKR